MKNRSSIVLGLRANWKQFALLAVINAFVGAMVGLERTVVPLIAKDEFGIESSLIVLSFLISFGVTKALTNMFAGRLSEHLGRKKILVSGWVVGLAVPLLLIYARSWGWVIAANIILGINQGLCWSTTVIMKVDLVGPKWRGVATRVNEFSGYSAVGLSTLMTGFLATTYGPYPIPFYPDVVFALVGWCCRFFLRARRRNMLLMRPSFHPQARRMTLLKTQPAHFSSSVFHNQLEGSCLVCCQPGWINEKSQ